ncbi:acyltransferase domain-containing protein [Micromonospora inaquosa]|uniref:acyltransferase domain-containing protein n=1 Tax=Micromonospora inaquosa TaxID=2203716 RepID=UPI0013157846|nr:acyltransferase domain-containing protein [Micromonospora inaquosa]
MTLVSRNAFLFPGQGAYADGALGALRRQRPEVDDVFAEIDRALEAHGVPAVAGRLLGADAPTLAELLDGDPVLLQLALYGTDVVLYRILTGAGVQPDVLLGHSLGEIAALVAAGAFSVGDGAVIVSERTAVLRPLDGLGAMTSLATNRGRAAALLAVMDLAGLAVAVDNGPEQVVVSGPLADLDRLEDVARRIGVALTRLRSPYPFHNSLLAPAADDFGRRIQHVRQRPLRARVHSPILGRAYHDLDDLPALLARHFTMPVGFQDAVRDLHGRGVRTWVECGARAALTSLVRSIVPGVVTVAPLDGRRAPGETLAGAVATLRPASPPTPAPPAPSVAPAVTPPAAAMPALGRDDLVADLREFYAQALEYPVDVLTADAELEADLGVDSLKQTELLTRLGERYGFGALPDDFRITELNTLDRIASLIVRLTAAPAPDAGTTGAVAALPAATLPALGRDDLVADLREFYAQALEYPVDVLTADAELEADLGVDSLKQTELLTRLGERYGFGALPDDFRITELNTLDRIADLVRRLRPVAV